MRSDAISPAAVVRSAVRKSGIVYFVGAGPGSPDLVTLRGLQVLRAADLVIADNLLPPEFFQALDLVSERREIVHLSRGETRLHHWEILQRMADAARSGRTVARLKNGDPFLFGRACEETEFMRRLGIPWEVVPGLTAGTAGPTLAGLPLTSRQNGRSIAFVTARERGGGLHRGYPCADTLVFYMPVQTLGEIARELRVEGWPPETPFVILENASLPGERRFWGRLAELDTRAAEWKVCSPAVLVVGEAAIDSQAPVSGPGPGHCSDELPTTALVLVDHGSRLSQANRMLEQVAHLLRRQGAGRYLTVEPAHMELAEPTLEQAFDTCVRAGARKVGVVLFFLSPGRHSRIDIPRMAAEAAARHPGVEYFVTEAIGLDERMGWILLDRAKKAERHRATAGRLGIGTQPGAGSRSA